MRWNSLGTPLLKYLLIYFALQTSTHQSSALSSYLDYTASWEETSTKGWNATKASHWGHQTSFVKDKKCPISHHHHFVPYFVKYNHDGANLDELVVSDYFSLCFVIIFDRYLLWVCRSYCVMFLWGHFQFRATFYT